VNHARAGQQILRVQTWRHLVLTTRTAVEARSSFLCLPKSLTVTALLSIVSAPGCCLREEQFQKPPDMHARESELGQDRRKTPHVFAADARLVMNSSVSDKKLSLVLLTHSIITCRSPLSRSGTSFASHSLESSFSTIAQLDGHSRHWP
jgi:hypothetical protein